MSSIFYLAETNNIEDSCAKNEFTDLLFFLPISRTVDHNCWNRVFGHILEALISGKLQDLYLRAEGVG